MTSPVRSGEWARPAVDVEALGEALLANLSMVIRGKPDALRLGVIALLSGGHLLVEDVPGVAKTLVVKAVAASLDYVYISTDHLQRRLDRNLFAPTIDATGTPIFPKTRPNPTIANLSINESTAKSRYQAVVTSVQARYGRLNAQATYTLAWNKDDDSNERTFNRETALNPLDLSPEYTWAKQDARYTVSVSGVAGLPGGFAFGVVLLARSGLPYTAVIGFGRR